MADQNVSCRHKLRKIVKATKRYGVKAMNLSARSNILGNIINALERILNHQRAIHFIWQCYQGKTSSIPSLAVCCKSVILWPIWGGCTFVISIRFSGNVILSTYFQKLWQNFGVNRFVKSCNAKRKQQSQLRKIVNTSRRYVLRKKFLNLLLCWIFSFVDTCRYYWEHISRSFCWRRDDKILYCLCWS